MNNNLFINYDREGSQPLISVDKIRSVHKINYDLEKNHCSEQDKKIYIKKPYWIDFDLGRSPTTFWIFETEEERDKAYQWLITELGKQ